MGNKENGVKARFFEISLLNAFFCMLVVFIHVSSKPVSTLERTSWQYISVMIPWRLSSFVVQGFIFLSGLKLFLNKANRFEYRKFLYGRFVSIVVPYVVWVIIYYIYFYTNNYFQFHIGDLIRYILIGNLVSPFYFIIVIVQFYLLAPFWIKIVKKSNITILVTFSLMITIISGNSLNNIINIFFPNYFFGYSDRVFTTYLIYWVSGCFAGLHYEKFKETLHENLILITSVFCISVVGNLFFSYLSFSGKREIHFLENIHVLYCISAILFFYIASIQFTKLKMSIVKNILQELIMNINKISYGIYLSHCIAIFMLDDFIYKHTHGMSAGINYFIRIFTVYATTISCMLLWNKVIGFFRNHT